MTQFDDSNTAVIFKHDKKGNDKAPDYSGKVNMDGKEMRLAMWLRKSNKDGSTFMSGQLSEYQEKSQQGSVQAASAPKEEEDFSDSIPF